MIKFVFGRTNGEMCSLRLLSYNLCMVGYPFVFSRKDIVYSVFQVKGRNITVCGGSWLNGRLPLVPHSRG